MTCFIQLFVAILVVCGLGGKFGATAEDNIDWGEVRTLLTKINKVLQRQKEANAIENIRLNSLSDDELMTQYQDGEPLKRQNPLTGDLFTEFGRKRNKQILAEEDMDPPVGKRQNPLTGDLFTEFGKRQNPLTGDLFTEFGKRQNPLTGDLFTEFGKRRGNDRSDAENDLPGVKYEVDDKRQNPLTGDLFTEFGKRRAPLSGGLFIKRTDSTQEVKSELEKRQNPLTGDLFTEFGKRQKSSNDRSSLSENDLEELYLQNEEDETLR